MFISVNNLANELPKDKPYNLADYALQDLGDHFEKMRIIMQFIFQNFNFRGTGLIKNSIRRQ